MASSAPGARNLRLFIIAPIGLAVVLAVGSFALLRSDGDTEDDRVMAAREAARAEMAYVDREPVALAVEPPVVVPPVVEPAGEEAPPSPAARLAQIEAARAAGILGQPALAQGGAFASLTGTGDISAGFDDLDIQGGLLGIEPGEMQGGLGFGSAGVGPGGGGNPAGTGTIGSYAMLGHGAGTTTGYGVGGGRGGLRGRSAGIPQVRIGQPETQGDLDKAIIRRYIKRSLPKITYCYEKQLLARPVLQGTVRAVFTISPDGTVASSTASGVDDQVASCVADTIGAIEFPKPKGGGSVHVRYPFTFRPEGG